MEDGNLNTIAVSLHHWSTVGRNVRRADGIQGEEDASFITLSELHPHSDGQALLGSSEEWNHLHRTAARWIAEVQVVVDLDGCSITKQGYIFIIGETGVIDLDVFT